MRFDEVWMHPKQLAKTAVLAASTNSVEGEVVEIGAWQGMSTVHITKAVAPAMVHVVDHWLGSEEMSDQIRARDNFSIFLSNMNEATDGNFRVHRMGWRDWVKGWSKPIRFLHLDATHTVSEVADNLEALLPFARPGSIYAGDDWDWPTVREGVLKIFIPFQVHTYFNKLWWVEF